MDVRLALRLNALFSIITGAPLTVTPSLVGGWLGVEIDGWLRLLGVALLGHAAALFWIASRSKVLAWTRLNVAMIAPYPLLMVALAATGAIPRDLGKALAITDGVIVGALAVAQALGLRNLTASTHHRTT